MSNLGFKTFHFFDYITSEHLWFEISCLHDAASAEENILGEQYLNWTGKISQLDG